LTLSADDLPDNLAAIRSDIERAVPHGFVTTVTRMKVAGNLRRCASTRWRLESRYNAILEASQDCPQAACAPIGTLGTGNHFIELCPMRKDTCG
jgi:tRNA-splicing ligase RtcB